MSTAFRSRLIEAAAAPYRQAGRFAWHFARGKLARDPVFFGLLAAGALPSRARIVDLGCGIGLLSNWITAASSLHAAGDWPADWPAAPCLATYRGIELMPHDVERAARVQPPGAIVEQGDIRDVALGEIDVVVILDALHYIETPAQNALLQRVLDALAPGGLLIMRVGDAAAGLPFVLSTWVDRLVCRMRGHRLGALHCRPAAEWRAQLERLGFTVQSQAMDAGTPFANTLLLARRSA
ncbi:methyltransferase domain-containing protein [Azoarcus sp. L1K30]|uniref:class I SAM-dependent methyltransferase n=1 Tax=Azoarcus sp. L1K30 TaxID=2820277 RepID=UPI001B83E555|nr:methyltransferase domain-containing protein [Azoarcus sp. L1K30]MBR0567189.1 methyltransferase domain-containing protein [Azoarcus sp. L1K30]